MNLFATTLLTLILFLLPNSIIPSGFDSKNDDAGLFEQERLLRINLISDYDSLLSDRGEDPSYHDGFIEYTDNNGDLISVDCRIKVRGNFRKNPENCKFPPLLVNIRKKTAEGTIFEGEDRLKLVTHCQLEKYVIEEYLVYKLYNKITDFSFRVRLTEINYIDISKGKRKEKFTRYAFFIEEDEQVAERLETEIIDKPTHQAQVNRDNVLKMALFQFMIGNKDWFVTSRHNIELLQKGPQKEIFAVPYDFDWSAIIYPAYTVPDNVPIELLENRQIYKGMCQSDEEVSYYRQYFNEMRPVFSSIYSECEYLSKGEIRKANKYLEGFYEILNDEQLAKQTFQQLPNCLMPPPGTY